MVMTGAVDEDDARGEKLSANECQGSNADGDFLFFSKAR